MRINRDCWQAVAAYIQKRFAVRMLNKFRPRLQQFFNLRLNQAIMVERDNHLTAMDVSKTVETRINLPTELYQEIEQQAKAHGCSVNGEIVALLAYSLSQMMDGFEREVALWEAASDEDWLNMEARLAPEEF